MSVLSIIHVFSAPVGVTQLEFGIRNYIPILLCSVDCVMISSVF